ncbi:MAG TPA: class I SAM-dependent methyltransferase [Alphaproteobacteria bacterium]
MNAEVTLACMSCGASTRPVLEHVLDNRFGAPGEWRILRCQACGLEQTAPRPNLAELKTLYETYYNYGGERDTTYTGWRERLIMSQLYQLILKVDGDISFHGEKGSGRLLDVGCNEGRPLVLYRRNGFKPEGVELNSRAAEVARRRGFMVYETDLAELRPSLPFDRVVFSNVLEHALAPRAMLADANRLLVTGGEVWISLPNARSWLRALFGRIWINWHVPFHLAHFDAKTLTRLLADSGFTVVSVKNVTPALWVAQSIIATIWRDNPKAIRSAPLIAGFMIVARGLLFPILWLGNRLGRGDCLVIKARKD